MTPMAMQLVNVRAPHPLWVLDNTRRFCLALEESQALTLIYRDRLRKFLFSLPEAIPERQTLQKADPELISTAGSLTRFPFKVTEALFPASGFSMRTPVTEAGSVWYQLLDRLEASHARRERGFPRKHSCTRALFFLVPPPQPAPQ